VGEAIGNSISVSRVIVTSSLALRASGNLPVSHVLTGNLPPINYQ